MHIFTFVIYISVVLLKSYIYENVPIYFCDSDRKTIFIISKIYGCARMYVSEKKMYDFTDIHLHM